MPSRSSPRRSRTAEKSMGERLEEVLAHARDRTALLNALEGKRAVPRAKPPFPQVCGLFGKPTIVNNAETIANIPHIVNNGPDWFKGLSRSTDSGTKLYGVSGRVKRPGLWELPIGVTIRELLEEHAGGMLDGYEFRGVIQKAG